MQKVGLKPTGEATPTEISVDETVVRVNGRRCWLSAAVDTATNQVLHVRLFPTLTTQLIIEFLRELRAKHHVDHAPDFSSMLPRTCGES